MLALPELLPEADLSRALETIEPGRLLVFCDEEAPVGDPIGRLRSAAGEGTALLVGPEGGFDPVERERILARPNVCRLSLGPRVLRADTAAVAALAAVQAARGDWR